jgi:hypothetical protein
MQIQRSINHKHEKMYSTILIRTIRVIIPPPPAIFARHLFAVSKCLCEGAAWLHVNPWGSPTYCQLASGYIVLDLGRERVDIDRESSEKFHTHLFGSGCLSMKI